MVVGVGVDITDLARIKRAQERSSNFASRVLTANELEIYENLSNRRQLEFLGGRFSAKESYSKAYGTGIGSQLSFQDIELLNDESGQPQVTQHPLKSAVNVAVSISHTEKLVLTEVLIER
ncbi:holo-ACP synthase [Ligilactobacillus pobuzihii]|uniref:Holo-[acyl-carrier-protein] synthase n=1 Tax=Ligilactobacillus pobuzihii TaxID=449659 RepID=A0A0R2LFU8_9LACO|nr:holo-ACP synthase [Ligilactobacillus pobuzihii]KRK09539.1 holo-(acyl-carrier-protein) synthase [Ligilactobacillus pobuzihii E100301 = KCTC 13174]KRN97517.1 holo-(acyl-carrier-protein) synthase [Ligilactobacillus pobuzihii]GEN48845.1 holo-[acyl-carrier-protein] synthase [Ligilactobacillus pobuzihii]